MSFTDTKHKYLKDYCSTAAVSLENKYAGNRMLGAQLEWER